MLTIQRDPVACSNATAVMNGAPIKCCHGATKLTAAITTM